MEFRALIDYALHSFPASIVIGIFLILFIAKRKQQPRFLEVVACLLLLFNYLILGLIWWILLYETLEEGHGNPGQSFSFSAARVAFRLTSVAGAVLLIAAFAKRCRQEKSAEPPTVANPYQNPYQQSS